jgi:hypothetical protein
VDQRDLRVVTIDGAHPGERVAAVMFPADALERTTLAGTLGPGWTALDGRKVDRAGAVFVRPCSIQTVAGVRRRFPDARIVVVESSVPGTTHRVGPIQRLLQAGADQYLTEDGRRAA